MILGLVFCIIIHCTSAIRTLRTRLTDVRCPNVTSCAAVRFILFLLILSNSSTSTTRRSFAHSHNLHHTQCVRYESCGWCQSRNGNSECLHGSELGTPSGSSSTCDAGWKFSICEGENPIDFLRSVSTENNTMEAEKNLKRRHDVYKDDADFAKHNMDALTNYSTTMKKRIASLKIELETCKSSQDAKTIAAEDATEEYTKAKAELDDLQHQVEETTESLQQERSNAENANSGKSAILSLVADLEQRLDVEKKKVSEQKSKIAPLEQKKDIASLDRDEQAESCEKQELALKRAEIQVKLQSVNQQYRKEIHDARVHDTQVIDALLKFDIPASANAEEVPDFPYPLGTSEN